MNKIITILILVIIGTSFVLTLSYSAGGEFGVQAVVPATPYNTNINHDSNVQNQKTSVTKQNKFLLFFEKFMSEKDNDQADNQEEEFDYDKYYSYGVLIVIMLIVAAIVLIILKLIDKFIAAARK